MVGGELGGRGGRAFIYLLKILQENTGKRAPAALHPDNDYGLCTALLILVSLPNTRKPSTA